MLSRHLATRAVQPARRSMASISSALEEFPGLPATSPSKQPAAEVQQATLPNGVKVLTHDAAGGVSTVGVFVRAGSRYGPDAGTAHFLEHMAFKTTHTRSSLRVWRQVEALGADFSASSSREVVAYSGTALRENVDDMVELLADSVLHPKMRYWEVSEEKSNMAHRVEDAETNPATVMSEGLMSAAFGRASGLGRSQYCDSAAMADMSSSKLLAHLGTYYNASNMVIAATNVSHDDFVGQLMEHWLEVPEGAAAATEAAKFVGGESHLRVTSGNSHVSVALTAPSLTSDSRYAALVLDALVGSSDASFGPYHESGCQARLPKALASDPSLAAYASSFYTAFSDAGLVGVSAATSDANASKLLGVVADVYKGVAAGVSADELSRAKAAVCLRHMAMMEPTANVAALGLPALLQGGYTPAADFVKAVQAVSAEDVAKLVKEGVKAGVAVSDIGSNNNLPRYDHINQMFN